jgi:hypothetical protein
MGYMFLRQMYITCERIVGIDPYLYHPSSSHYVMPVTLRKRPKENDDF